MSDEGRVMPSRSKGALGLDEHLKRSTGLVREESRVGVELLGKPVTGGAYVS